jgi:hypothetical protein
MSQALWKLALRVSVPVLLAAAVYWRIDCPERGALLTVFFEPAVPTILAILVGWYAKHSCEKFLHYQRLREVYVVLELAHTAHNQSPILD